MSSVQESSTSPCRISVLLARAAPEALVLRRGPSRWVQLLRWRTDCDEFHPGQWFKGRIYDRRSDLSPLGTRFIYFASKIDLRTIADREHTYAWTAVSRPPYFTALALWPKGDCWHGGGLFERLRNWSRRRTFREGRVLSKFIARDVRGEIDVVSAGRIDEGIITGRVRTTNVLYLSKGWIPEPEFEAARELRIDEMWRWTGKDWGGLPDGTSIADRPQLFPIVPSYRLVSILGHSASSALAISAVGRG